MGHSRGGLTAKIHMVCDANGMSLRFILSSRQVSDIAHAQSLLDQVELPVSRGDHASVVAGYRLKRAMTQNTCVITATVTKCTR
jgi:hypothetical protein